MNKQEFQDWLIKLDKDQLKFVIDIAWQEQMRRCTGALDTCIMKLERCIAEYEN